MPEIVGKGISETISDFPGFAVYVWLCGYEVGCGAYDVGSYAVSCAAHAVGCAAYVAGCADLEISVCNQFLVSRKY